MLQLVKEQKVKKGKNEYEMSFKNPTLLHDPHAINMGITNDSIYAQLTEKMKQDEIN